MLIWKYFIDTLLIDEIFVAVKLKALVSTLSEVGLQAWALVKGINIVFSNQFKLSGFPDTWIIANELYEAISWLGFFGGPHPLQLFGRVLQPCLASKLQKCFESYKTSIGKRVIR